MERKGNNTWKSWLFSLMVFLLAVKVADLVLWYLEKNEDHNVALVEGKSWREYMADQCKEDAIEWAIIQKELLDVHYEKVVFHPYRWFVPAPSYKGKYIQTDARGFRLAPKANCGGCSHTIGFFGGSTTFSLYSDPENTLPVLFNKGLADSIEVINYGVGAYSSTSELMCLVEVLRESNLDQVIFYDGVNEIGRFLESKQSKDFDHLSDKMGAPYSDIDIAVKNTFSLKEGYELDEPWYGYVLKMFCPSINRFMARSFFSRGGETHTNPLEDAKKIVEIYRHNKMQIKALCSAYDVHPIFVWQPHLFNTAKELSSEELAIKNFSHTAEVGLISEELDKQISQDPEVIMLTTVLDTLTRDPIFFDWHHLNKKGRKAVSKALVDALAIRLGSKTLNQN